METKVTISKTSAEIAKYVAINGPGVYTVIAGNNNWVPQEGLPQGKYIVNLKAIAKQNVGKFLGLFEESDEIAYEQLNGLTMTANIPVTGRENVPMKNQQVKINVDYVSNRDKTDKVLAVVSIEVPKARKGDALFAAIEAAKEETGRIAAVDLNEESEEVNVFSTEKDKVKA